MTIVVSAPSKVEMPSNPAGRKADLPFEHSTLDVGESVFVAGKENKGLVDRVYNNARRTYGKQGEPKIDPATGEQKRNAKGTPLFNREYSREFTVRFIPDGAIYGKQYKGTEGYALFRTK